MAGSGAAAAMSTPSTAAAVAAGISSLSLQSGSSSRAASCSAGSKLAPAKRTALLGSQLDILAPSRSSAVTCKARGKNGRMVAVASVAPGRQPSEGQNGSSNNAASSSSGKIEDETEKQRQRRRAAGKVSASKKGGSTSKALATDAVDPLDISETEMLEKALEDAKDTGAKVVITVDNNADPKLTKITVETGDRPRLLQTINATFHTLGVDVVKAEVNTENGIANDVFFVRDLDGRKLDDAEDAANVAQCLEMVLSTDAYGASVSVRKRPSKIVQKIDDLDMNAAQRRKTDLLYNLMGTYLKNDVLSIQESIVNHVEYTIARSRYKFDDFEAYQATAHSVRDRLLESWNDTQQYFRDADPKRIYYLSMEFLMGRTLLNALYNMNLKEQYEQALSQLGYNLEDLVEKERDAALGNGGLGRLAACFLDSMASLNYPAWGYGIRYQYGMFRQTIVDGYQREQPDYWLTFGNPWEVERTSVVYHVKFYGHVGDVLDEDGNSYRKWIEGELVEAVAYDNPIPGYDTLNTINLRLWGAKPSGEFDLESFNTGDYVAAILNKQRAESISSVLYPDDRTHQGRELRLKQQHFFVSATLQDILRRFKDIHDTDDLDYWDLFPEKVAIQLNDTHPSIGVPELMRLLIDDEALEWDHAWEITSKVFSFTNHTVLPEAMEKWPIPLLERLLPRHLEIIYQINDRFMNLLKQHCPTDFDRMARMSIVEEGTPKVVRMAHLALVAVHTVNGVAAIHTSIIKSIIFKDFYELWPEKFQNKTNGVTQRRWLAFCNPDLREVIDKWLETDKWVTDPEMLRGLVLHADNPELHSEWQAVKRTNKERLALVIKKQTGIDVNVNAMFDVQVKRIHEYKRQLLNVLSIIYRYICIKNMSPEQRQFVVPRVCVLGGKAAPGYDMAKRIIKLVSAVGEKINNDDDAGDLLKVVFLADYNVSLAEVIIPATELSQHISTAGTEASGTSNMKFAMNGALIVGTMDGANVEIAEEIGEENMFIFGLRTSEVATARADRPNFVPDPRFTMVVDLIRNGFFGAKDYLQPIIDSIEGYGGDYYLVANDFVSYLHSQALADQTYTDPAKWTKMSILSTANSAKFSSDRTIRQYAEEIWNIQECQRPQ